MSKRRFSVVSRRGHGGHGRESAGPDRRPSGPVRPVKSCRRFGRTINTDEHGDYQAFSRLVWLIAGGLSIITLTALFFCK